MVEFALVITLLLFLIFGIIEFGRIFNATLVVNHAARESARQGVVTDVGREAKIIQVVESTGSSLGLSGSNVIITSDPVVGSLEIPSLDYLDRGDILTVTVHYDVELVAPIISSIVSDDGKFRVDGAAVMRVE